MIAPQEAEKFFFRAMIDGYVSDKRPLEPVHELKLVVYSEVDLVLQDMWFVVPNSDYSHGCTTIRWKGEVVWVMYYGGWYRHDAIPTLKAALREAYTSGVFVGGRGPREFPTIRYLYTNNPEKSGFADFEGREEIHELDHGTLVGTHWYHGQWLT